MRGWGLRLGWGLLVLVGYALVASGAGDNFFIEGTEDALRTAHRGQERAGLAALLLLPIGLAAFALPTRFPRAAGLLVAVPAALVLLTSQSEAVLFTGLLAALPVGLGLLLGLVPQQRTPGP